MIRYKLIIKTLAALLLIIAGMMLFPLFIAIYYGETLSSSAFIITASVLAIPSLIILYLYRNIPRDNLSTRDGFLLVTVSWITVSLAGSLPYILSGAIPSMSAAFFETMSGFTTTGASILTDIQSLPKSILFWRSLTHWLGGMGIVVLTVAILPLLGIGGMQLIRAEAPGPTVDKLTPRIAETAKILWFVYIGFTVAETVLLMFAGMNLYEALTHTFGTLATGGFSTKNSSVAHFDNAAIDAIITFFMVLAGVNFSLHYRMIFGRYKTLLKDTEFKAYIAIFIVTTIALTISLTGRIYSTPGESLRYASFQVASILTTTGYATADYELWPHFSQTVLFILMFVGGSSGSTGGGIKVIRLVTLLKQGLNEMKYLLHPRGIFTLRISGRAVRKNIVYAISGFFFLYIFMLLFVALVIAFNGHDLLTAFTTALATVGNIGPGFGAIGPTENYSIFSPFLKWFLSFAMLIGRLEIYTVLVLFTPRFWNR